MKRDENLRKINILDYVRRNKDKFNAYKNVEELTVLGKREITTNLGRQKMYIVCKNQNGHEVVVSPFIINWSYKKTENGTLKPKDDLKCMATPVNESFMFADSSGGYVYMQPGDFVVCFNNKNGHDMYVTGMEMFEFADKYALAKKPTKKSAKVSEM